MIINLSTIDFDGGGGGSAKPAKLQEKTTDIEANGTTNVFPDEGFDGISLLSLRANIPNASALNFASIGYDEDFSSEVNAKINDDVAYSKTLYNAWNPNKTSANSLYEYYTKLVYAPNINTSNVTSMNSMFQGCKNLTTIPLLNTSKVTSMTTMFQGCSSLTTIPQFDTSNVRDMYSMFYNCSNLKNIPILNTTKVTRTVSMFNGCTNLTTIPNIDTSNVTGMNTMFNSCSNLKNIPLLNTSNVTSMGSMFSGCAKLETLPLLNCGNVTNINTFFGYSNITTLTQVGGFKDLKIDWKDSYGLQRLPNLTYQSILNVLNNLYDFRGNGDSTTTRTIKFHANALAQMTDEDKAIATNKGWVIS